jgi:hypothetical protein
VQPRKSAQRLPACSLVRWRKAWFQGRRPRAGHGKTSTRPAGRCPTVAYVDYRSIIVSALDRTVTGFARPRQAVKPLCRMAARRRRGLDRESADRAIINVAAMRAVVGTVREIKYQILQITKTLARKPKAATHWSVRAIAKETGIAKSTSIACSSSSGLQPHRTRSFKLSTDLFFVEKLRDVVGLYLNPPDKVVVLCVDEKSQIQALERIQPCFVRLHRRRHPRLPAPRHNHAGSPPSMCSTARSSPKANAAIVIRSYLPSCSRRGQRAGPARHPPGRRQLRHPQASQGQSLARPPSALAHSLRTIRLGSFDSTADLVKKIDHFIRTHNANSRPFVASRQRSIRSRWELVNAPVPTTNSAPALRSMTFATSRGRRHGEAEHAGGLMVDDQLELGLLRDRQIGRLGT